MMGSEPATGKLAQVCTVLATLVPSTSTWSTVRCSLSVATMTTVSSGMLVLRLNSFYAELEFSFAPLGHVPDHYSTRWPALRAAFLRRLRGLTSPIPTWPGVWHRLWCHRTYRC